MNRRDFLKANAVAAAGVAAASLTRGQTARLTANSQIKSAGIKMIPVENGKYRVWTKKVGSGRVKVLLLHGGPGATHEYFECFEDFLPQAGIEFYYYDQLGSHYSDQPTNDDLWSIHRFVEEVETVRRGLGLEKFYLLGHSWGGMLGIEYALKYQQHLKGLIISNMTASVPSYVAYVNKLRGQLPKETIAVLDKYESAGDYKNAEYQQTMLGSVYTRHLCRLDPWPEPVERTFKHFFEPVYNVMQGPNEFVITGNFKNWDRWADLPKIKIPTLTVGARHDTMNPDDMRREADLMPNARFALCPNGSHMCMWDDQAAYFRHLLKFIRDNERGLRMK